MADFKYLKTYTSILVDFNHGRIFSTDFNNSPKCSLTTILSLRTEVFHEDGPTDKQMDRHGEDNGHFLQPFRRA
jgi:hypothetical protein